MFVDTRKSKDSVLTPMMPLSVSSKEEQSPLTRLNFDINGVVNPKPSQISRYYHFYKTVKNKYESPTKSNERVHTTPLSTTNTLQLSSPKRAILSYVQSSDSSASMHSPLKGNAHTSENKSVLQSPSKRLQVNKEVISKELFPEVGKENVNEKALLPPLVEENVSLPPVEEKVPRPQTKGKKGRKGKAVSPPKEAQPSIPSIEEQISLPSPPRTKRGRVTTLPIEEQISVLSPIKN